MSSNYDFDESVGGTTITSKVIINSPKQQYNTPDRMRSISPNTHVSPVKKSNHDEKIKKLLAKSTAEREEERRRYEDIIANLKFEIEKLTSDYNALRNEFDQLNKRIAELEAELQHYRKLNSQLQKENSALKNDNKQLQDTLQAERERAERDKARARKDRAEAEAIQRDLARQLEEERRRADGLEQTLAKTRDDYEKHIISLKQTIDSLKKKLEDKDREISDKNSIIARLNRENADAQQALARVQKEADELYSNLRSVQEELAREKQAHKQTMRERDEWRTAHEELQRRLEAETAARDAEARARAEAEQRLQKVTAELRDADKLLAARDREIQDLKQRNNDLQGEMTRLRKSLESQIRTLQEKLDIALKQRQDADAQARADRAAADQKIAALTGELEQLRRRIRECETTLKNERQAADQKLGQLQKEADGVRRKLASADQEIIRMREVSEHETQQNAADMQALQQRADGLGKELDRTRAQHTEQIAQLEVQIKVSRTEQDKLRKTISEREAALNALGVERDRFKRDLEISHREFSDLQGENARLADEAAREKEARMRAERDARSTEKERDTLHDRLQACEAELTRTRDEDLKILFEKERSFNDREQALLKKIEEIKRDQEALARKEAAHRKTRGELDQLRNDYAQLEAEHRRVVKELDDLRRELDRPRNLEVTTRINMSPKPQEENEGDFQSPNNMTYDTQHSLERVTKKSSSHRRSSKTIQERSHSAEFGSAQIGRVRSPPRTPMQTTYLSQGSPYSDTTVYNLPGTTNRPKSATVIKTKTKIGPEGFGRNPVITQYSSPSPTTVGFNSPNRMGSSSHSSFTSTTYTNT